MKMTTKTSGVSLHFEKHKANNSSVNGLQRHNEREPGGKHKNENIDDERTADNVFLKRAGASFQKTVEGVISENRDGGLKGVRKDAVRMVEATVQLSGQILERSEEEQEAVLRDSYEWLKENFGEANIVSANIHKDETNMHLHFDFVPMDENKNLNAKKVLSKQALRQYQTNFLEHLQDTFKTMNFQRGSSEYNGLSQDVYEKLQEERKDLLAEVEERELQLDERVKGMKADLDHKGEQLKAYGEKLKSERSALSEREEKLNLRESGLNTRETTITRRETVSNDKAAQIDARNEKSLKTQNTASQLLDNVKQREENVKQREENVKQTEASLKVREKGLSTREEALNDKVAQIGERDTKSLKTQNRALQLMREAKVEKQEAEMARQAAEREKKDADDGSKILAVESNHLEQLLKKGVSVTTTNIKALQEWMQNEQNQAEQKKRTPYELAMAAQEIEKTQKKPTKEQDDFLSAIDGLSAMTDKGSMSL